MGCVNSRESLYINELSSIINIFRKQGRDISADILQRHLDYVNGGTAGSLVDPDEASIDMLQKASDALAKAGMQEKANALQKMAESLFDELISRDRLRRPVLLEDAKSARELGADNAAEILTKAAAVSRMSLSGYTSGQNNDPARFEDQFWKVAQKAYIQKDPSFETLSERVKEDVRNRTELMMARGNQK